MTLAPQSVRTQLPLVDVRGPHGSRSAMTCHYRCGDACDQPVPNPTDHGHVRTEIERVLARRAVLAAGGAGAGALVLGGLVSPAAAAPRGKGKGKPQPKPGRPVPAARQLGRTPFSPVAPNKRDRVSVPPGFRQRVLISWGDPVTRDAPRFDVDRQTPEAAARQFGFNNDYVGVLPLTRTRALLVVNHEYTTEPMMFPEGRYTPDQQRRIAMANHGMSVVEIQRANPRAGSWEVRNHRRTTYNRRVTTDTPFRMTGPAAGHAKLRTSADPTGRRVLGTLNNCAGGMTPWGTVLSGEENFNQYFQASGTIDPAYATSYARYGITASGGGRGWHEVDPRFDLSREPNEPYRFGWIVEIDPYDPTSTPVKHTMLGRFKHEGANIAVAKDGRVVAYTGDDERNDYIYKFVSRRKMMKGSSRKAKKHNMTLLTEGTLYVAKLVGDGTADGVFDGTGTWIPLASDRKSFVPGMSVAEVLLDTRLAADKVGPTKMDRPEDIEPSPVTGKVYCALTNNSTRGTAVPADEANPITSSMVRADLGAPLTPASGNRNGYVLELTERRNDPTATSFTWNLLLVCGDPEAPETYFGGFPKDKVSPISCPDNVAFDKAGNLWVSTDGNALGSNDGLFRVPVTGPERGRVQQFLTVPLGAETCGPLISDDQLTVFVAVQHPGETDGATFAAPSSTWPHSDDFPRPSVVAVWKG